VSEFEEYRRELIASEKEVGLLKEMIKESAGNYGKSLAFIAEQDRQIKSLKSETVTLLDALGDAFKWVVIGSRAEGVILKALEQTKEEKKWTSH